MLHTRPAQLLARSRLYVGRWGEAFEEFCKVSLRDFVQVWGAAESELAARSRGAPPKFAEALSLCPPFGKRQ